MNLKIRRIRKSGSSVNSNIEPIIKPKKKTVFSKKSVETREVVNLGSLPKNEFSDVKPKELKKINVASKERDLKMNDVLIYFYEKYRGDWDSIMGAIEAKEEVDTRSAIKLVDEQCKDYDYTTVIDPDYPEEYKKMKKPPFVIKRKKYRDDKEY